MEPAHVCLACLCVLGLPSGPWSLHMDKAQSPSQGLFEAGSYQCLKVIDIIHVSKRGDALLFFRGRPGWRLDPCQGGKDGRNGQHVKVRKAEC